MERGINPPSADNHVPPRLDSSSDLIFFVISSCSFFSFHVHLVCLCWAMRGWVGVRRLCMYVYVVVGMCDGAYVNFLLEMFGC